MTYRDALQRAGFSIREIKDVEQAFMDAGFAIVRKQDVAADMDYLTSDREGREAVKPGK